MPEKNNESFLQKAFTVGTPECAVLSALIAMVLALLFLWLGFGRMLLIAAVMALGAFLGGVKNKKAWLAGLANRFTPVKGAHSHRKPASKRNDDFQ